MFGEEASFLEVAFVLIGAAFAAVLILTKFRLPSILGYLAAGLVVGPSGLGLITESEGLSQIAEVGVIFLLFMLGIEFSFARIIELRRAIFGLGFQQVFVVTVLVAALVKAFFDLSWATAIIVGGAVAMSSTALCLKQLAEQRELATDHGRIAVAILLFQDLATVVFLIFIGAAAGGVSVTRSLIDLTLGVGVLIVALAAARIAMRPVSAWLSRELESDVLQLSALFIAIAAAFGAQEAGLSPAIGAFIAGMVIGESDARHAVEKEIRPFRDLLVGIFFVTIGAKLDLLKVLEAPLQVLGWLGLIIGLKWLAVAALVYWDRREFSVASRSATILAHGGEFGLLLVTLGMANGALTEEFGQPLFLAIGASMFVAPVLIGLRRPHSAMPDGVEE
ncbi:cation:proton antiporter [Hyphococcus sp.]|uniref:cation:proton antiporter n=1 Tax=Hyphococcus sp. TaxID=2038636 RepID=UPI003D096431